MNELTFKDGFLKGLLSIVIISLDTILAIVLSVLILAFF